ncbi:MAG: hypothetical protein AAFN76_09820 [Pseudomonadota bacterium]
MTSVVRDESKRRLDRYQAVFDEIDKTLSVLSSHPLLKEDVQFLGLLDALLGVEDGDTFFERVVALQTYVDRVARAHGVAIVVGNIGIPNSVIAQERPQHLAEPADQEFQRTRLQVR